MSRLLPRKCRTSFPWQVLLEQLAQRSFHLFPQSQEDGGQGGSASTLGPQSLSSLGAACEQHPILPLLLLFPGSSQEFLKFATTEAIQRTEIFEYCQMLGHPKSFIPSFQVTEPAGDRQLGCGQPGFQLCCVASGTSCQLIFPQCGKT